MCRYIFPSVFPSCRMFDVGVLSILSNRFEGRRYCLVMTEKLCSQRRNVWWQIIARDIRKRLIKYYYNIRHWNFKVGDKMNINLWGRSIYNANRPPPLCGSIPLVTAKQQTSYITSTSPGQHIAMCSNAWILNYKFFLLLVATINFPSSNVIFLSWASVAHWIWGSRSAKLSNFDLTWPGL